MQPALKAKPIRFICSACGTQLSVDAEKLGESGPCPNCGTWIDGNLLANEHSKTRRRVKKFKINPNVKGDLDPCPYTVFTYNFQPRSELIQSLKTILAFVVCGLAMIITYYVIK
jgi:predicted RNA-binding Zn-ribbon protein involved in translation (DUF1610 family)